MSFNILVLNMRVAKTGKKHSSWNGLRRKVRQTNWNGGSNKLSIFMDRRSYKYPMILIPLLNYCCRWPWTMDKMGLLCVSHVICSERHSPQWVSGQKMEYCKLYDSFMNNDYHQHLIIFTCLSFSFQHNNDTYFSEETVGKVILKSRNMYLDEYMFWICVIALFAFSFLFNFWFILALTYLNRMIEIFSCI